MFRPTKQNIFQLVTLSLESKPETAAPSSSPEIWAMTPLYFKPRSICQLEYPIAKKKSVEEGDRRSKNIRFSYYRYVVHKPLSENISWPGYMSDFIYTDGTGMCCTSDAQIAQVILLYTQIFRYIRLNGLCET